MVRFQKVIHEKSLARRDKDDGNTFETKFLDQVSKYWTETLIHVRMYLIELHQNEMRGVKEEMEHTLERIECVEYRFTERTAELHESVENCLTRISKQEVQSQELLQQPMDSYMTMDSKILLNKFIGFFINICVVGICIFSNVGKLLVPFVANKVRLLTTTVGVVSIVMVAQTSNVEVTSILVFLFILVNCIYTVFCW